MEKIIDRENKEAVKALKKDNFYFRLHGSQETGKSRLRRNHQRPRKPEAKKIKAAV